MSDIQTIKMLAYISITDGKNKV